MFGLFKRHTQNIIPDQPVERPLDGAYRVAAQEEAHELVRRAVQLRLHSNMLFPSGIYVVDNDLAEVYFFPSNVQSRFAVEALQRLQQNGHITLDGPLMGNDDLGWTARLRVRMS